MVLFAQGTRECATQKPDTSSEKLEFFERNFCAHCTFGIVNRHRMFHVPRTPVRPARKVVPKEFNPENRLTSKKYVFVQTVPRPRWCPPPKKREVVPDEEEPVEEEEKYEEEEALNETKHEEEEASNEKKHEEEEEKPEKSKSERKHRHRHRRTEQEQVASGESEVKEEGDAKAKQLEDEAKEETGTSTEDSERKKRRHKRHRNKKEGDDAAKTEENTKESESVTPSAGESDQMKTDEGEKKERKHRHHRKRTKESQAESENKGESTETENEAAKSDEPMTSTGDKSSQAEKKEESAHDRSKRRKRHHRRTEGSPDKGDMAQEEQNDAERKQSEATEQDTEVAKDLPGKEVSEAKNQESTGNDTETDKDGMKSGEPSNGKRRHRHKHHHKEKAETTESSIPDEGVQNDDTINEVKPDTDQETKPEQDVDEQTQSQHDTEKETQLPNEQQNKEIREWTDNDIVVIDEVPKMLGEIPDTKRRETAKPKERVIHYKIELVRDKKRKDENRHDQTPLETNRKRNTQNWGQKPNDRSPLFRDREVTPKKTNKSAINDVYKYWTGRKTPKNKGKKVAVADSLGRRKIKVQKISVLDDPVLVALRRRTIDTHDFKDIPDDDLELLLEHTREYTRFAASRAYYDEARKGKDLQDAIVQVLYHKPAEPPQPVSRQAFEERKRTLEGKWHKELENFDADTQHKLLELQERQENELREFDDKWKDEETLRKYRKPSARLLQLWRQEKFMARIGHFDEAEIAGAEAQELEAREMAMAQAFANRDYNIDREKIIEKHNHELEMFGQTREHWRELIVSRQKNERTVLDNNDNALDIRQKDTHRQTKVQRRPPTSRGSPNSSKKFIAVAPEISFDYQTVLPPLQSPAEIATPSSTKRLSRPESRA